MAFCFEKGPVLPKFQATLAIACLVSSSFSPFAVAEQAPSTAAGAAASLPSEPAPNYTRPLEMRSGKQDYSKPNPAFPYIFRIYQSVTVDPPVLANSGTLSGLIREGKIYLSLSDAVVLALKNNYDIAIQRYNLDIADTDILRAHSGANLLGVSSGLVEGTLGGSASTSNSLSSGGGPGGTSTAVGGAGAGSAGIVSSTNGSGPLPEVLDPVLTGTIQLQRETTPEPSPFLSGASTLTQNTNEYNFNYNQGFLTGTQLAVGFDNSRVASNSDFNVYSPLLQSNFQATLTQHLLYGFGPGINGRFIVEAKNDRRISDSAFRQQILYTINQVENIYWQLVADYEDVQAKQSALQQSTQLAADDRRQLTIGTLAPLDVLNADNGVASDTQNLITSQTALEYQQLIMKQAISRDLNDPVLSAAPVIPTDRISLAETPEERTPVEQLVEQAYANRPEIEQSELTLKNDEITLRGVKNGLLPTLDLYAFYGGAGLGGAANASCDRSFLGSFCDVPAVGYNSTFGNLFNNSGPNRGVGVNLNVPLRNREAQALAARALLEYRQAEMRMQQLYVQVRIQVINGQYALTNDRAALQAAQTASNYNTQAYQAEVKKLRLGASTTANVQLQEKNVAAAENNVISTEATYAKDRASLEELLAETLDRYGISLSDAVTGQLTKAPSIPGIEPAPPAPEAVVPQQEQLLQQTEHPAPAPQPLAPGPQPGAPQPPR